MFEIKHTHVLTICFVVIIIITLIGISYSAFTGRLNISRAHTIRKSNL